MRCGAGSVTRVQLLAPRVCWSALRWRSRCSAASALWVDAFTHGPAVERAERERAHEQVEGALKQIGFSCHVASAPGHLCRSIIQRWIVECQGICVGGGVAKGAAAASFEATALTARLRAFI
jgi:hypothetical protein